MCQCRLLIVSVLSISRCERFIFSRFSPQVVRFLPLFFLLFNYLNFLFVKRWLLVSTFVIFNCSMTCSNFSFRFTRAEMFTVEFFMVADVDRFVLLGILFFHSVVWVLLVDRLTISSAKYSFSGLWLWSH